MLLKELNENKPGVFVGLKFSKKTINDINNLCDKFDIPNRISNSDLHTTLLYSKKHIPYYNENSKLDESIIGQIDKCDIWDDNNNKILVIKFKSKELTNMHNSLKDKYNVSWDFPTYIPHISVSYDCGNDIELNLINKYLKDNKFDIEIINEYHENLKE